MAYDNRLRWKSVEYSNNSAWSHIYVQVDTWYNIMQVIRVYIFIVYWQHGGYIACMCGVTAAVVGWYNILRSTSYQVYIRVCRWDNGGSSTSCGCVKNKSKRVFVYTAVHISLPRRRVFCNLPCDGLDFSGKYAVFRKQPAHFLQHRRFTYVHIHTYILWATAGTTGITVVNLRSRNTKQTQMMRETQQQQYSTAEAVKLLQQ